MKYICKSCNYETHDKSHFDRHKNTKKHEQNLHNINIKKNNEKLCIRNASDLHPLCIREEDNENNKFECKYCGKIFSHHQNMYRHINYRCKSKNDEPIVKKLEIMIDNLEKQNKTLENQNEKLIGIVVNNSETIKKSVSALSYVTKQYPNAPVIEELEYDKFDKITKSLIYDPKNKKKTNYSIEDVILFHFKKNNLPEVLGKAIVEEYKKTDPKNQSMWASDVSRLAFIVKSAIGKSKQKKSKWITDKNGIHFSEMIIKPMFEIIKDKMKEYVDKNKVSEADIRNDKTDGISVKLSNIQLACELIRDINASKFEGKVLKYVAPYFNLNINNSSESDCESSKSDDNDSNVRKSIRINK